MCEDGVGGLRDEERVLEEDEEAAGLVLGQQGGPVVQQAVDHRADHGLLRRHVQRLHRVQDQVQQVHLQLGTLAPCKENRGKLDSC